MSRIRGSGNATTELRLIALLRAARVTGWRRRYPLPGKPDFTFPLSRLALFVDGCFWHGHDCGRNLTPKRNAAFWQNKVARNQRRDRVVGRQLRALGWRVIRVWECALARDPSRFLARLRRRLPVAGITR